jgi:type I restriction enzyme M protein
LALKKSDLYSSLWRSCDELRGGMDASQYKDYILTLLFVKYVSDQAAAGSSTILEVPKGASFADMVALKGSKDIGEGINTIIGKLAKANGLINVIDQADFNDDEKLGKGKEMVATLSKLVAVFQTLDFRSSRAEGDDLLGDAYEYLMQHFATESGKSKGQFYTPAEVSRVLAKVAGIGPDARQDQTVFDPTCGSGSLLLKAADEAPRGLTIYGQEKDNATWSLAVMNMILHGNEVTDIRKGDTITNPQFVERGRLKTFDFAVANPPFSAKSWNNGLENDYGRFEYGTPPDKNGDYAFLLHILKSLKSTGKAAVILPHGVLFRGHAEASIRRQLVDRGYIKGIIGLPANLFYGTGIPACIIVLDKQSASERAGIFIVDASKGFKKDGNKNRLRPRDMHKIVDVFNAQTEIPGYARMVPISEIREKRNDYNLNIPRYVDSSEPTDVQDLGAHLHGGIPEHQLDLLDAYWRAFPTLRAQLFRANRPGYSDLALDVREVASTVEGAPEFQKFATDSIALLTEWFETHRALLLSTNDNTRPYELIGELSEDLLSRFRDVPLLDAYAVYELLMTYWHDVMHDDVFMLMREGWLDAARPRAAVIVGHDKNGKPRYEDADIVIGTGASARRYVMDLIPPALVVSRYLSAEQQKVIDLNGEAEAAAVNLQQHLDEHAVEDGLAWDAVDDAGKVTQKSVNAALREARAVDDGEVVKALTATLDLIRADAATKKAYREARLALDHATVSQYARLDVAEIQALVLNDKWATDLRDVVARLTFAQIQALGDAISELGSRYERTLSDIDALIETLSNRVETTLHQMGVL